MQLTRLCILIIFLAQVLFLTNAVAADPDREIYQVKIRVSGSERLRTELASALTREFRRIPDVTVEDEAREWLVGAVVMEIETKQGYVTGYVCSVCMEPKAGQAIQMRFLYRIYSAWAYDQYSLPINYKTFTSRLRLASQRNSEIYVEKVLNASHLVGMEFKPEAIKQTQ